MLIDYVPIEVNRVTRRYVLGCDRRGCSLAGSVRPVSQAPGYIASNGPPKAAASTVRSCQGGEIHDTGQGASPGQRNHVLEVSVLPGEVFATFELFQLTAMGISGGEPAARVAEHACRSILGLHDDEARGRQHSLVESRWAQLSESMKAARSHLAVGDRASENSCIREKKAASGREHAGNFAKHL